MLLDFYRYYYNQDECARRWGPVLMELLDRVLIQWFKEPLQKLFGRCLDGSASYSEAKAEIDANRPVGSIVPGHARACFGWKRQNIYLIGATRLQDGCIF